MKRPILLVLCVSLAWTLACATAVVGGGDDERRLWNRQVAATSLKFTLVQAASTPAAETTRAVVAAPLASTGAPEEETTAPVRASTPPSVIAEPSSTAVATTPATTSAAAETSASTTSSAPASSRTPRQLSAAQSSISLSSSAAPAPSASSKPLAVKQEATSFLQPSHKLFPAAVVMFIAIGLIACLIGILIIKKCCHRSRFADPRDYADLDQPYISEKRSISRTGLLSNSPDSFNHHQEDDEKSIEDNHHQDAGMRMTMAGLNFVPQPYQLPAPRSTSTTASHRTHRRTATIILPPTPAVTHTPHRQPSHPPHSLRPFSPHRNSATPPSRVVRVPVPTYEQAATQARSQARSSSLPPTPPPIPIKRPFPPVPAAQREPLHQRSATIAVLPPQQHQPKDPSGLRYLYGEREVAHSRSRTVMGCSGEVGMEGDFGAGRRMGRDEGRVLG